MSDENASIATPTVSMTMINSMDSHRALSALITFGLSGAMLRVTHCCLIAASLPISFGALPSCVLLPGGVVARAFLSVWVSAAYGAHQATDRVVLEELVVRNRSVLRSLALKCRIPAALTGNPLDR